MGGIWIGLTLIYMPIILLFLLVFWFYTVTVSGWSIILTGLSALLYLVLSGADQSLVAVMGGCLLISLYKQRADLAMPPRLRLLRRA
jgi:hypothetical protein